MTDNKKADQQAAILDKALAELAELAPRHVRKFTRQVRSGDKQVTAHIEIVKIEETDGERIDRLEKQIANQKATIAMLQQYFKATPAVPFDLRNVRINEDDTKGMGLYDPSQSPIAS